jgi:hypothetical protein
MTEHTSLELSKRLYDKGFRGIHGKVWIHKIVSKELEWLIDNGHYEKEE